MSLHIHEKGGLIRSLWLFRDSEVCELDVKCGGHAQEVEVVAGTCKRMRGRQIEMMRDGIPVTDDTKANLRQPRDRLVRSSTRHRRAEGTERWEGSDAGVLTWIAANCNPGCCSLCWAGSSNMQMKHQGKEAVSSRVLFSFHICCS